MLFTKQLLYQLSYWGQWQPRSSGACPLYKMETMQSRKEIGAKSELFGV